MFLRDPAHAGARTLDRSSAWGERMEYSQALESCQPTSTRRVDVWTSRIAALLWPSTCVLCGQRGQPALDLCAPCERDLPRNDWACVRCAMPLASAASTAEVCGACLRRAPLFDACVAPFRYGYPLDRLIHGLKYRRQTACGRVLGGLLAAHLRRRPRTDLPQLLIPTPLAPRRYRTRGFNQAHEIALPLARALQIPIRSDLLIRQRETDEQAELRQAARRRNVRSAFTLVKPLPVAHVAVLDDVITTGSTANEMAKVLRRAGAVRVEVWAIARSV